ncbi:MAG: hypothetical protein ACLQVG_23810 [Terriglobia bacterium]
MGQFGWEGEALECGSLLPLSVSRSCSRAFRGRAALARVERDERRVGASKLAGGKAAASCRTLKLRKHAARERKAADRHNKSRYGLA